MPIKIYLPLLVTSLVAVAICNQDWSVQVENGETLTIKCEPTDDEREPMVYANSTKAWHRLGDAAAITDGQLVSSDATHGMYNVSATDQSLTITQVTPAAAGIYLCKVGGVTEGTIVKGVNVNGEKKSGMDKYRDNVITGVLTGIIVCLVVCSGCLLDHFQYRSPEEKEKLANRKQERLAKHARLQQSAVDNPALETGETEEVKPAQEDTHL